jgi:hypothetical protein
MQGLGIARIVVPLCVLFTSRGVQAFDWISLGTFHVNSGTTYVDASSVQISDGIAHARFKAIFSPHLVPGSGRFVSKWQSYQEFQLAINCLDHTTRVEKAIVYFEDGTNVVTPPGSIPITWEPVKPNSVRDRALQFVCHPKP